MVVLGGWAVAGFWVKAAMAASAAAQARAARVNRVMAEGDWVDAMRSHIPAPEKLFTWWSYRSPNWEISNKGRRLDHVWITRDLHPHLRSVRVHTPARGWEKPSDHAPVIADFEIQ